MRPRDREAAQKLDDGLLAFDQECHELPGIHPAMSRSVFVEQLIESKRRLEYLEILLSRAKSHGILDPNNDIFDPLQAAAMQGSRGQVDEAFWLVFLSTHFGKHARAGWRYVREVYGRLGDSTRWDWINVSADVGSFREWLRRHRAELERADIPGGFGNHRKYESLNADSPRGTGAAVASYVEWVNPPRTHLDLMSQAYREANQDSNLAFDVLYHSMETVVSFGRTARFDYLATVGNLHLAPIRPGLAYLRGSTGPIKGARLLFGGRASASMSARYLEEQLKSLDGYLGLGFQVLEDAMCNWQKSPIGVRRFRG